MYTVFVIDKDGRHVGCVQYALHEVEKLWEEFPGAEYKGSGTYVLQLEGTVCPM